MFVTGDRSSGFHEHADLVKVRGQFDPKFMKMCPASDRAED
jgi:hypothetical protein